MFVYVELCFVNKICLNKKKKILYRVTFKLHSSYVRRLLFKIGPQSSKLVLKVGNYPSNLNDCVFAFERTPSYNVSLQYRKFENINGLLLLYFSIISLKILSSFSTCSTSQWRMKKEMKIKYSFLLRMITINWLIN